MASPSTRPTDDKDVVSDTELKIEHQEDQTDNQTIGIKREREEDQEKELER